MTTEEESSREELAIIKDRSLFSMLFTYRGRDNVNPEENFFTEGLAFILENDSKLLLRFIEMIIAKFPESKHLSEIISDKAKVRTQVSYRSKSGKQNYIDLEINFSSILLWVEIKVGSGLSGEDQIKRYGDLLDELNVDKAKSGILLLSKHHIKPQTHKYYIGNLFWVDLYEELNNYLQSTDINHGLRYVIENYKKFLEENNMTPFEPFNEEDINALITIMKIGEKVQRVLTYIHDNLKEKYGNNIKFKRRSSGDGYEGQKVRVNHHENSYDIYYAVVTSPKHFGSIDMWFTPNSVQKEKIKNSNIDLSEYGVNENGGNYFFRSTSDDLEIINNAEYREGTAKLVIDKIEKLIELIG